MNHEDKLDIINRKATETKDSIDMLILSRFSRSTPVSVKILISTNLSLCAANVMHSCTLMVRETLSQRKA